MKRLAVVLMAGLLLGCGDDIITNVLPALIEDPKAPKKCLADPCDPGCPLPTDLICGDNGEDEDE